MSRGISGNSPSAGLWIPAREGPVSRSAGQSSISRLVSPATCTLAYLECHG